MNVKQQDFMAQATRQNLNKEQAEEKYQIYCRLCQLEKNIDKDEMIALAKRIKPIIRDENGYLHWIEYSNIKNSFLWNRYFLAPADNLTIVAEMTTYHDFAYHGLVRPSALEILSQLPDNLKNRVTAYEVILPCSNVYAFTDFLLNRHILKTVFYSGDMPEVVACQPVIYNPYE